jgi:PPOX class probable F420-dependent enzyme
MQVPPLDEGALKELLERPLVAELGTVSAKGDISITPIWFEHQDGTLLMSTWEDTRAVRNIKRNPRCALMIDFAEAQPYYGVHYRGRASLEGPENDAEAIGRLFARYMGGDVQAATEYGRQLIGWGKRVFVRFRPEKATTWDFRQGG